MGRTPPKPEIIEFIFPRFRSSELRPSDESSGASPINGWPGNMGVGVMVGPGLCEPGVDDCVVPCTANRAEKIGFRSKIGLLLEGIVRGLEKVADEERMLIKGGDRGPNPRID